jgi:hypothetical protein
MRRRRVALLVAGAVVLSTTGFTSPASAAPKVTCAKLGGPAYFKPPLPPTRDPTQVVTTFSPDSGVRVDGCTGRGGLYGYLAFKARATKGRNCDSLYSLGLTAAGAGTIKWQKGKASTISVRLTIAKRSPNPVPVTFSGTVKAGQFVGKQFSAALRMPVADKSCLPGTPLSRVSISLQSGTKFKLG